MGGGQEAFEKEQAAARAAWYEDAAQREGELRLANTLRHGWRAVAVGVADLGGLKVDADDALDETAEVEAFERARPPGRGSAASGRSTRASGTPTRRGARRPRVLVAAEDRGDAWAKTERERLRVARGSGGRRRRRAALPHATARTAPGSAAARARARRARSSGRRRDGR